MRPRISRRRVLPVRVALFATLLAAGWLFTSTSSPYEGLGVSAYDDATATSPKWTVGNVLLPRWQSRSLFSGGTTDCHSDFDQNGGIILYIIGTLFMFLGLAIVCDDFFVSALEVICEVLDLSGDVAGATFMAAGSSAPELFTSVMGVFVAKSDVGVGTIVGSAIFNILIIVGITAVMAGQVLELDPKPLMRDSFFYSLSIVLMVWAFWSGTVAWYEALVMLLGYGAYILFMVYNRRVMDWVDDKMAEGGIEEMEMADVDAAQWQGATNPMHNFSFKPHLFDAAQQAQQAQGAQGADHMSFGGAARAVVAEQRLQSALKASHEMSQATDAGAEQQEQEEDEALEWPDTFKEQVLFVCSLPLHYAFKYTIPDCTKPHLRKYYIASFLLSIVWVGVLSYFMVEWAGKMGCIMDISPEVMGLTILAAGTSVPDALSSVLVAREGEGDMAVSNAIGSNVFDILIGLGLPWLGYGMVFGGDSIEVNTDGIIVSVIILFGVMALVILLVAWNEFCLFPRVGYTMFALYGLFMIYAFVDVFYIDKQ